MNAPEDITSLKRDESAREKMRALSHFHTLYRSPLDKLDTRRVLLSVLFVVCVSSEELPGADERGGESGEGVHLR